MHVAGGRRRASSAVRTGKSAAVCLGLLFSVLLAGRAAAMGRCGDDVDGHGTRVACACGDLLVSSRTLTPADHVTHKSCPGNGLVVAADGPVTLSLDGRDLQGDGQGVGVLVLRGTLTLQGPGTVGGFQTGVFARGPAALGSVVGVRLAGNTLDGIFADGDGYSIQGSVAESNGRDGFATGGNAFALDANRAVGNHRYGFSVWGMGAHVGGGLGNEASSNGMAGFYVMGMMHEFAGATAVGNGGPGFSAAVMHTLLTDVHASANARTGIYAMGMNIAIGASTSDDNRGFGIWVMGMDLDDRGGNHGTGNAGLVGYTGTPSLHMAQTPELVQCRVGMMTACR